MLECRKNCLQWCRLRSSRAQDAHLEFYTTCGDVVIPRWSHGLEQRRGHLGNAHAEVLHECLAKHNETLQAVREVRLLRPSASISASAMFRMMKHA